MSAKRKKVRYRRFEFKLSEKQKKIIDHFCKLQKTSPNKLIKKAIRDYIERHRDLLPEDDYISENQLQLFDFDDEEPLGEPDMAAEDPGDTK